MKYQFYNTQGFWQEKRLIWEANIEGPKNKDPYERWNKTIEKLGELRKEVEKKPNNTHHNRYRPDDIPKKSTKPKPQKDYLEKQIMPEKMPILTEKAERMDFTQNTLYRHYLDSALISYLSHDPNLLAHVDKALDQAVKYPKELIYDNEERPGYIVIRKDSDSKRSNSELNDDLLIVVDDSSNKNAKLERGNGVLVEVNGENLLNIGGKMTKEGTPWSSLYQYRKDFYEKFDQINAIIIKNEFDVQKILDDEDFTPQLKEIYDMTSFKLPHRVAKLIKLRNQTMNIDAIIKNPVYEYFLKELEWHPKSLVDFKLTNDGNLIRMFPSLDSGKGKNHMYFDTNMDENNVGLYNSHKKKSFVGFSNEGYLLSPTDPKSDIWNIHESYYNAENLPPQKRNIKQMASLVDQLDASADTEDNVAKKSRILKDIDHIKSYIIGKFGISYDNFKNGEAQSQDDITLTPPTLNTISFAPHPLADEYTKQQK